jgi:hypothetical protein
VPAGIEGIFFASAIEENASKPARHAADISLKCILVPLKSANSPTSKFNAVQITKVSEQIRINGETTTVAMPPPTSPKGKRQDLINI